MNAASTRCCDMPWEHAQAKIHSGLDLLPIFPKIVHNPPAMQTGWSPAGIYCKMVVKAAMCAVRLQLFWAGLGLRRVGAFLSPIKTSQLVNNTLRARLLRVFLITSERRNDHITWKAAGP